MQKVIIIGAGPAGLTAAYELLKNSDKYQVIILESEEQVGGISRTIKYHNNRMDIGGHRFFSKSEEIMNFFKEIMPIQGKNSFDDKVLGREKKLEKNGPDPEREDCTFLIRDRVSRIYYLKKFFDYPITLKWSTLKNLGFFNVISSGFSYIKATILKRKETSLENFYINRFGKKLYKMFFEGYTFKVWGRHPSKISADWGSQRAKGLSVLEVVKDNIYKWLHLKNKSKETSLIESFYYPKYGPGQFYRELEKKIKEKNGEIRKGCTVTKIKLKNNKITSIIYKNNGKEIELKGDIFISSMPLKDLIESFSIKVDPDIKRIATNLPYRDFMTVGLLVKKLKLKNTTNIRTLCNIIPDCWLYIQDSKVKLGRIQVFNNWSPYMVEDPLDSVWLGLEYFCNETDKEWTMKDEDFINRAIDELVSMNIIDKSDVLDSHLVRVKKAYPAYFDTYKEIDKLILYLNKIPNLYCIGRNGQHRYNNMDHSMMTAMIAAKKIINNDKNKSDIWNVNVEKVYHEKK